MKNLISLSVLVFAILITGNHSSQAYNFCWSGTFDEKEQKTNDFYLHQGKFFRRFTDKPFTGKGVFKSKYSVIHVPLKDGVMNGESVWYYDTGELLGRGMVLDNFFVGKHSAYGKNGKIESETTYSNKCEKVVGKSFFSNGKVRQIYEQTWDKKQKDWKTILLKTFKFNGELASELDSKGNGSFIEYNYEGKLMYDGKPLVYKNFESQGRWFGPPMASEPNQ